MRYALQTVLATAPVGMVLFADDGYIEYANAEALRLFGQPAIGRKRLNTGDFIGCSNRHTATQDCGHSPACPLCPLHAAIANVLADGAEASAVAGDVFLSRDIGLPSLWVNYKAHPITMKGRVGAVVALQDITERKKTEESLRESEAYFRRLFDESSVGAAVVDRDFRFQRVNPQFCRFIGYSEQELLAMRFSQITFAADIPASVAAVERIWSGQCAKIEIDKRYQRKDGAQVWGRVSLSLLRDAAGRPQGILPLIVDITSQKHIEAEKATLEGRFQQAQRLESVGRLAGGVAHDFNNLLSVIMGYADMLTDELKTDHPHYDSLSEIRKAAGRATDLTRQLLAFSRKQVMELQTLDLNGVVAGFEKLIHRVIGEDIELELALSAAPLPVRADAAQIEQVLMNLAVNARDAMPDGGKLRIATDTTDFAPLPFEAPPSDSDRSWALISFSDTGCGMESAIQKHVFEPFFTTKCQDKGTGLGLATSYGIVRQHEGYIRLASTPGQGTTFKVYLPLTMVTTARPAAAAQKSAAPDGSATILLVEDDPGVRKLTRLILERRGYKVIESGRPEEAVRRAAELTGPLHLVLADVVMPGLSGPEVYAAIRDHHPAVRVLYMSGFSDEVAACRGVLTEGANFIHKPFSGQSLTAMVTKVLSGAP